MLFSNELVAGYINRCFEPAWVSTRPVPIVHIDFGNGNVVTRTLHGNIATSVCNAEGEVLDILPGIYTPVAFAGQLGQFALLANYVDQEGPSRRAGRLQEYHRLQAERLRKKELPAHLVNVAPISKAAIENRLKAALVNGPGPDLPVAREPQPPANTEDLAGWKLLAEDTALNESVRRMQIHELLLKEGLVRPEKLLKPLFRDVLHADLDDPYLGLGTLLFAHNPFKDK